MKKNDLYLYLLLSLALLVCIPGRFAFGLVLIVEFYIILIVGLFFKHLIYRLKMGNIHSALNAIFLVFCTTLYKQLVSIYSPIITFTLGFALYLPIISSFMISTIDNYSKIKEKSFKSELSYNLKKYGSFSLIALLFFALREIISYGSLSVPGRNGLLELFAFNPTKFSFIGTFFASVPGALLLVIVFFLIMSISINRKSIKMTATEVKHD